MMYLFPFLIAFITSMIICQLIIWRTKRVKIKNRTGERHIHSRDISRFGGVAIILSFVVALLLDQNLFMTKQLWAALFASLSILFFGLMDDVWEISWRKQLALQLVAVSVICVAGVSISHLASPWGGVIKFASGTMLVFGYALAIFWVMLLMNALNWIDGADGLSGGISAITALVIFLLSLKPEVNQPPIAIISIALVGALMGFLIYNIHPAKIMAGTSGSLFMGFILGTLSIIAGTKIATTMLVLSIPILDALWVVLERIKSGVSIFEADTRHMHHKLLNTGWSHRSIWIFFCSLTALIAIVALNTMAMGKMYSIFLVSLVILGAFFVLRCKNRRTMATGK